MADLEALLERVRRDAAFREAVLHEPATALRDAELDADELRALEALVRELADSSPRSGRSTWDRWVRPDPPPH